MHVCMFILPVKGQDCDSSLLSSITLPGVYLACTTQICMYVCMLQVTGHHVAAKEHILARIFGMVDCTCTLQVQGQGFTAIVLHYWSTQCSYSHLTLLCFVFSLTMFHIYLAGQRPGLRQFCAAEEHWEFTNVRPYTSSTNNTYWTCQGHSYTAWGLPRSRTPAIGHCEWMCLCVSVCLCGLVVFWCEP